MINFHRLFRRLVYLSEGVCNHGLDVLRYLIEADNLRCWLRFEAVQPVEKLYHHFQRFLLASLNMLTHLCPHILPTLVTFECEVEVFLLKRDRVVEVELRSGFEHPWDSILGEVPREGTQDVGKNESNIVRQRFGEDGGQSGECIVGANSDAGDSAIREDKNGIDGVDVFLYFISDTPLVDLILLNTTSVGQSGRIKDANLGRNLNCTYSPGPKRRRLPIYRFCSDVHKSGQSLSDSG